jgi:hypothetical protein
MGEEDTLLLKEHVGEAAPAPAARISLGQAGRSPELWGGTEVRVTRWLGGSSRHSTIRSFEMPWGDQGGEGKVKIAPCAVCKTDCDWHWVLSLLHIESHMSHAFRL